MSDKKNLSNEEAIKKIKDLVDDIKTCMFCTNVENIPFNTRPMATLQVDDEGNLWFFSETASGKNDEIKNDDTVQLLYAKSSDSKFLTITGKATLTKDKGKIEELWTPMAKEWFPEGKDDPNISVIKITPGDAYYWDTINGKMITLLKIAKGAITGNPSNVGVEGEINV
jgi:general stress protein 26